MSAGSLASQMLAAYVADMWSVEAKRVKYGVLADSYIGVPPDNAPSGKVLNFYGACDVDLKLPASVTAKCKAETLTVTETGSAMFEIIPSSSWLFINSMGDDMQRLFYQLTKDGIAGYPFTNQISPDDFFAAATEILETYKARSKHVSTFIVRGAQHVFLNGATWYETVSTTGDELGKYVGSWLANIGVDEATTVMPTVVPTTPPVRLDCDRI
jgi:hypothetical protein